LRNLPLLDDERLGLISSEPVVVTSALRFEEELHDAATLSLAESLDRWSIHGYVYKGSAVMLAQKYSENAAAGPLLISVVQAAEYDSIVDMVHYYWSKANNIGR
jgi:hypothetical protein